ncbi:HD domain-containing protein [Thomasclavelia sp.]
MIDLKYAKEIFNKYVANFDKNNPKITLKIEHTYRVMEASKNVAVSLNLTQDNIELAALIGLLHDIGRFEQLKRYDCFIDSKTIDHALLGVQILFDNNLIEKFNIDQKDYQLIYKAIFNHNKYEIARDTTEYELLHCKIIRDADKIDIFKTGLIETFEAFLDVNQDILENDVISESIYETFMSSKSILSTTRKTDLDRWVSFLALIFDLNYQYSRNYVYQQDYITKLIQRLDYKNSDTCKKMINIMNHANDYLKRYSDINK